MKEKKEKKDKTDKKDKKDKKAKKEKKREKEDAITVGGNQALRKMTSSVRTSRPHRKVAPQPP